MKLSINLKKSCKAFERWMEYMTDEYGFLGDGFVAICLMAVIFVVIVIAMVTVAYVMHGLLGGERSMECHQGHYEDRRVGTKVHRNTTFYVCDVR